MITLNKQCHTEHNWTPLPSRGPNFALWYVRPKTIRGHWWGWLHDFKQSSPKFFKKITAMNFQCFNYSNQKLKRTDYLPRTTSPVPVSNGEQTDSRKWSLLKSGWHYSDCRHEKLFGSRDCLLSICSFCSLVYWNLHRSVAKFLQMEFSNRRALVN